MRQPNLLNTSPAVKGGFKSEDTGEFLHCQMNIANHYPEQKNLNSLPKTVSNLFKF